MSFANALKWSFLAELATKLIQPVVFIILARFLTPDDFGVMTSAIMVVAFSQVFWEAGMGKALIQRKTEIEEAANAAFWINIILAVLISFLLYMLAYPIAHKVFQDGRVTDVLQIMTLQVMLGGLGSVQVALLQKEMGFKKLFWIRFSTVSLPGLASIPMAIYGWNYWSLVAGTLLGQLVQVFLLWRISAWKPCFVFDVKVAVDLSRFGVWVGVTGFLVWFYQWADALVVGMFLGGHDLGLYRMGNQLVSVVFAVLIVPILPVVYSSLATTAFNRVDFSASYNDLINSLVQAGVVLGIVIFVGFYAGGGLLLGEGWSGVGIVAAVFGLIHGFAWIVGFNGEYYRASGRPQLETYALVVSMPIYLGCYVYFASFGLLEFLYARLALVFVGIAVHLYFISRFLFLDYMRLARNFLVTVFICFCSLGVAWGVNSLFSYVIFNIIVVEFFVLAFIFLGMLALNKREFSLVLSIFGRVGGKK